MNTPPTDFKGGAWATASAADGDAASMMLLLLLLLLLGAVFYAASKWANHAQKDRLLKIRQRKYNHIKKAAETARNATDDAELQAAKLFEACRKHLHTATADHEKLLAALKKAAEAADIEHKRLKVDKIDRSRALEPPRAGYLQPQSAEVYVIDEDPAPVSDRDQRRERASKAIKGFFEYWVKDANGADMGPQRLDELHRLQKNFAVDLPADLESTYAWNFGRPRSPGI